MPKLINKRQTVRHKVKNPMSLESSIVSCVVNPKPGVDPDFGFTRVVSQTVWLLGIKLWFLPRAAEVNDVTRFRIVTGFTAPSSAAEIAAWDDVMPLLYRGVNVAMWQQCAGENSMAWEMHQVFTGVSRRFGIWAQAPGLTEVNLIQVSFVISEVA